MEIKQSRLHVIGHLGSVMESEGTHDFQYSSLSTGVHTKTITGHYTTDDHSVGERSMFPEIMEQAVKMCLKIEVMLGDALYSNRKICSITEW